MWKQVIFKKDKILLSNLNLRIEIVIKTLYNNKSYLLNSLESQNKIAIL